MASDKFHALVVDDDLLIQKQINRALTRHGFECEFAVDGEQAAQMANQSRYDVVITDLRMPNMNGHSLALLLLEHENRPILSVLTGVLEPRLVKDLYFRGVDDVHFKPVDFDVFAIKVKAMVERRRNELVAVNQDSPSSDEPDTGPVSLGRLGQKLAEIPRLFPLSDVALDVYEMSRASDWDALQIAAAIQRDAALTTEILRVANSSLHNPSGRQITLLDEAVLRIGQKCVGDVALTISALSATTAGMLPWMDVELAWKRSMAAGLAVESLIADGGHQAIEDGLMLSALMHPLGRAILGVLFPKRYNAMVTECTQNGESLADRERQVFPIANTDIVGHLLDTWQLACKLYLPLKFAGEDFKTIGRLAEPMRTKAELVKVAILLGNLAVNRWERWDLVELPPGGVLMRLGISDAERIVDQAAADVHLLAEFCPHGKRVRNECTPATNLHDVAYCNLSGNPCDLVPRLLRSLGIQTRSHTLTEIQERQRPSIVNCAGVAPAFFKVLRSLKNAVLVSDENSGSYAGSRQPTIALPNSYSRLEGVFRPLCSAELRTPNPVASTARKVSPTRATVANRMAVQDTCNRA